VTEPILAPDLAAGFWPRMEHLRGIAGGAGEEAYLRLAHACWSGERDRIALADLRAEIERDPVITSEMKVKILAAL
jgi:hypothetical protein